MNLEDTLLKYRLTTDDYNQLQVVLKHKPSSIEMALASALWNEHCSYKSSKKHLKKFSFSTKKKISAVGENAGIVDLGKKERVAFKIESHNHPSYLTPYHGAATGVGGILRDVFAMNARPVFLSNYLCFGSPKTTGEEGRYRVDGVIRGIGGYGNCIGIPTFHGHTEFSKSYDGNILVNAMALGFLGSKTKTISSGARGVGNYVVYAGATTGRDGVFGASMASLSFEKESKQDKPTVQIGDPFFGKNLMEACLESMDKNLIVSCQDMGAAGLTCSSFEMAEKGNLGLEVHLDKVPLREPSMTPEDILLSESQERMLFICKPSQLKKLKKVFSKYYLELEVIGKTLKDKNIKLYWDNKILLEIDSKKFTSQVPEPSRPYVIPKPSPRISLNDFDRSEEEYQGLLLKILQSPEGRSREFIYRQYDQRVGTNTVKDSRFPLGVLKLPESKRDLAVHLGGRNHVLSTDVEQGAKDAIFYPALQLALRGFTPWSVTDCLNFGNPEKPNVMGEFVCCVESIAHAAKILDTPIISGNVSFYNENLGKDIAPTPAVGMIGLKEKENKIPASGFVLSEEKVYLIYFHQFYFKGLIQKFISLKNSHKTHGALQDELVKLFIDKIKILAQFDRISSARVVGKFGILFALARMSLENHIGFSLDKSFPFPLFEERLYEVIVSVNFLQEKKFKSKLKELGLDFVFMGETGASDLKWNKGMVSLTNMKNSYETSWKDISL